MTGGGNVLSNYGAKQPSSKKRLKEKPYFGQVASGIGLGLTSGAVLPSDPSITRLNILKKFPGASMTQELTESPGTWEKPSLPDFDFAPIETF